MSDSRFKPPASNVVEPLRAGGPPRQMRAKLALATLIQLVLMCTGALAMLVEATSIAALNVMGLIALSTGLACLYAGVALLVVTRVRGRRFLSASIVLQGLSVLFWHAFYFQAWRPHPAATILLPIVLGLVVAVAARLMPSAWLATHGEL